VNMYSNCIYKVSTVLNCDTSSCIYNVGSPAGRGTGSTVRHLLPWCTMFRDVWADFNEWLGLNRSAPLIHEAVWEAILNPLYCRKHYFILTAMYR